MSVLENLEDAQGIKRLANHELGILAREIRQLIIETVQKNGGHLASNLGVVELSIALHKVFSTPSDSIVWDVGHQCYAHKILTGRKADFDSIRREGGLSGFPKRSESVHDAFDTGHASTSISAALGILASHKLSGEIRTNGFWRRKKSASEPSVIAVIGDGALTGGLAYEALSHAGQLKLPLIVVLNDNSMSISPNVGAISRYLSRLSATVRYQNFRHTVDSIVIRLPFIGKPLMNFIIRAKRSVKGLIFGHGIFADLGFEYAGPIDGHNIPLLCEVLEEARDIRKPVVVHIVTRKGKGHSAAEDDPASWHGVSPQKSGTGTDGLVSFTEAFGKIVLEEAGQNKKLVAITAAMSRGTGLSAFQKDYPCRFFDVGIAESHAVVFAAGLASKGYVPVVAIYSTFIQRAFDYIQHDISLGRLPVIFALDRAGAVPDDGETHQGIYDIQIMRAMPGFAILAPASQVEMRDAFRWAVQYGGPVIIRYPKAVCAPERPGREEAWQEGRGISLREVQAADLLIAAAGPLSEAALEAAGVLDGMGVRADVVQLRFLKPMDRQWFVRKAGKYKAVIVAEEGVLNGGVSESLETLLHNQFPEIKSTALGFPDAPMEHAGRESILARAGLDAPGFVKTALELLGRDPAGKTGNDGR